MKYNILLIATLLLVSSVLYDYSKHSEVTIHRDKINNFIQSEIKDNFYGNDKQEDSNFKLIRTDIEKTFPLNKIIISLDIFNTNTNKTIKAEVDFKLKIIDSKYLEVSKEQFSIDTTNFKQPKYDIVFGQKVQIDEEEDSDKTDLIFMLSFLDNNFEYIDVSNEMFGKKNYILDSDIGFDYKGDLVIKYYNNVFQLLAYPLSLMSLSILIILIVLELIKFKKRYL